MKLRDLVAQLSHGELSSFSFASDNPGSIKAEFLPKVISAINSSLTDLYTRFILSEKELHVLCLANKTQYALRPEFATMNPTMGVPKYILDTPDYPFTGDLIRILAVTDEIGNAATINDVGIRGSLYIPRYDTIQVSDPSNDKLLSVLYQARHSTLIVENPDDIYFDLMEQDIIIPPVLEEPLRIRTACNIFSPMDRKEQAAKVALLEAKYEQLVTMAEQKNLISDATFNTTCKLERRGFI